MNLTNTETILHKDVLLYGLRKRMTDEQEAMAHSILNNRITYVNAKAGTGKTTIAVAMAKYLWETREQRAIYITPTVEERTLGFTTGDPAAKELKYMSPLMDALSECNEQDPLEVMQLSGEFGADHKRWVEAKSHTFLRGSNIKGKTVIIDEVQNLTRGELKKVLTRISDNCTVIAIGHDGQIDLPKASTSGFVPYLNHFKDEPYCEVITLTKNFRGQLAQHADELRW